MKFLKAEKQATQYYFLVHLDDSQMIEGAPDPTYIREYVWGLQPPEYNNETDKQPITEAEYLESIKREIGLLVGDELSHMNPQPAPEPIPLDGF